MEQVDKNDYNQEPISWQQYLDEIGPLFRFCTNATVLEIGPYYGHHTKLIETFGPEAITLVENNADAVNVLRQRFEHEIIHADINDFLKVNRHFDVVVCCGVLYHLHSPVHLLELIVNMSTPKIVILESVNVSTIEMTVEPDNNPGMRYIDESWKSAKCNMVLPFNTIISIMKTLGYKLADHHMQGYPNIISKQNVQSAVFIQQ